MINLVLFSVFFNQKVLQYKRNGPCETLAVDQTLGIESLSRFSWSLCMCFDYTVFSPGTFCPFFTFTSIKLALIKSILHTPRGSVWHSLSRLLCRFTISMLVIDMKGSLRSLQSIADDLRNSYTTTTTVKTYQSSTSKCSKGIITECWKKFYYRRLIQHHTISSVSLQLPVC